MCYLLGLHALVFGIIFHVLFSIIPRTIDISTDNFHVIKFEKSNNDIYSHMYLLCSLFISIHIIVM